MNDNHQEGGKLLPMKFTVEFEGHFSFLEDHTPLPHKDLESFLDSVLTELSSLDNVETAKYRASLGGGEAIVSIAVKAEDAGKALRAGSTAIRTALHTVKAYTPGWTEHWCSVTLSGTDVLLNA